MLSKILAATCLIIIISACNNPNSNKDGIPYLFTTSSKVGTSTSDKDEPVIMSINVEMNATALNSGATKFKLPLPTEKEIVIQQTKIEKDSNSIFWTGKIVGDTLSYVNFTYMKGVLNGGIFAAKEQYRILYMGNDVYQIAQLNPDKMTESDNDATTPDYKEVGDTTRIACRDLSTSIDVLVVYTQAAETGAGGPAGIASLIERSKDLANESYSNSDVNQRINIVSSEKIEYTEKGDSHLDKLALQNPRDGQIDNVHTLRRIYNADIVVLIVETDMNGYCGEANIFERFNAGFADYAFAVVRRVCAADNLTFAHELGHLMGGRHHDDTGVTPYPFCHGHQDGTYRTVMSRQKSTFRMPYISNPSKRFPSGRPTGVTGLSENYKVFNESAAYISVFRCKNP